MVNIGTTEGRIPIAVADGDELTFQCPSEIFRPGKDFTLAARFCSAGKVPAAMPVSARN